MESDYRLEKTTNGIVPNKKSASMPAILSGLWAQAKELFGVKAATEKFCEDGMDAPHMGTLSPMAAGIGAQLASGASVNQPSTAATAPKTTPSKPAESISRRDGETWETYYFRGCAVKGETPSDSVAEAYRRMDQKDASKTTESTATAAPSSVLAFGDIIYSIKQANRCTLGEAIQIAVKQHPERHAAYLAADGGPIERKPDFSKLNFQQVVTQLQAEGLSKAEAVRNATAVCPEKHAEYVRNGCGPL